MIRHDGQEQTIDFRGDDDNPFHIHYAAFYADCEHEIRPLRKGYRLCLVYNLTLAKSKQTISAPRNSERLRGSAGSSANGRRTTRPGSWPSRWSIATPRTGSPGMR